MANNLEKISKIFKRKKNFSYFKGKFSQIVDEVENKDYRLPSFEEIARLRMNGEPDTNHTLNAREGILIIPERGIYFTKISRLSEEGDEIKSLVKQGIYFWDDSNEDYVQKYFEDSLKIPNKFPFEVPVREFGNEEITDFCFGTSAKKYGEFLENSGVKCLNLDIHLCLETFNSVSTGLLCLTHLFDSKIYLSYYNDWDSSRTISLGIKRNLREKYMGFEF